MLRALDLFCGAGGASMGLHRAGFDVTGIDLRPQPRYPFVFIQADALRPPLDLSAFDLIWASPPCQAYSISSVNERQKGRVYPDLVEPTRRMLALSGALTAIENVIGAPLRRDLVLDGTMFGLKVVRRRIFEINWFMLGLSSRIMPGLVARHGYSCVVGGGQVQRRAEERQRLAHRRRQTRGHGHRLDDAPRALASHPARLLGIHRPRRHRPSHASEGRMNPAKWLVIAWFAAIIAYVLTRLVRPKRARDNDRAPNNGDDYATW